MPALLESESCGSPRHFGQLRLICSVKASSPKPSRVTGGTGAFSEHGSDRYPVAPTNLHHRQYSPILLTENRVVLILSLQWGQIATIRDLELKRYSLLV